MDKNPSESALYQRDRRLKAKEAKEKEQDKIDRQIALASKKQKIMIKTRKDADWDFTGKEPYLGKNPEPQYQNEGYEQYNFWGQKEGCVNPLNHISHQKNLKALFGDKCAE